MNRQDEKITEVCWFPIRPTEKGLIGYASLRYGQLSLNSIAVLTRPDGNYRISFPSKQLPNGKVIDIFYPIDSETYEMFLDAIVNKIKSIVSNEISNEPSAE